MNQESPLPRWVEIAFDCLPLRSVGRLDIPIDASPRYRQRCEAIKAAIEKHGSHNSYYLHNATCVYHLTNNPELGMLEFSFEGVVLTDSDDVKTASSDLAVELRRETCPWLSEPIVEWMKQSVSHAVVAEFDRYIAAGDLARAHERIQKIQEASDDSGGFMGMYL